MANTEILIEVIVWVVLGIIGICLSAYWIWDSVRDDRSLNQLSKKLVQRILVQREIRTGIAGLVICVLCQLLAFNDLVLVALLPNTPQALSIESSVARIILILIEAFVVFGIGMAVYDKQRARKILEDNMNHANGK